MAPLPVPAAVPGARIGRARRGARLLALVAAVLAGHVWLVQRLAPGRPAVGMPHGTPILVRSLAAAPGPAPAAPVLAAPVPVDGPVPVTPPRPAAPSMSTDAVLALLANRPVHASPAATPPLPRQAAGAGAPAAAPATADVAAAASAPVATDPAAAAATAAVADGEPPPLYATRLPPAAQLRYMLQRNGRHGEALLSWQPGVEGDDAGYRLDLQATGPDGRVWIAQTSTGRLEAHGLAPDRFVDRRAAGPQRAASFRRDIGRIGYSGPSHQHPAWPGAQDRLSWLAQLVAILAAHPVPPPVLTLFVADATGQAGLWRLHRQPDATGPSPWGELPLQHWQRMAPRPEALQVDVWLAGPGAAAEAGGWPLRVRFSVPRSGDVLDLVLAAPP